MVYTIRVENIKCGGCANTIKTKIAELDGIGSVEVDIAEGIVTIDAAEDTRDAATTRLLKLGYPESGTAEGITAAKARAKSFVSCAVGRINS